jgi:hypothetical protein
MDKSQKKTFEDAFYLGFMTAFDGWNGETFSLSQRRPEDSEILVANMEKKRKQYELEQKEKDKLHRHLILNSNGDFPCSGV